MIEVQNKIISNKVSKKVHYAKQIELSAKWQLCPLKKVLKELH